MAKTLSIFFFSKISIFLICISLDAYVFSHNWITYKFQSWSRHCVFLGYPCGKKVWSLYDLDEHQFFVSWDVQFFESQFSFSTASFRTPEITSHHTSSPLEEIFLHFESIDFLDYPNPGLLNSGTNIGLSTIPSASGHSSVPVQLTLSSSPSISSPMTSLIPPASASPVVITPLADSSYISSSLSFESTILVVQNRTSNGHLLEALVLFNSWIHPFPLSLNFNEVKDLIILLQNSMIMSAILWETLQPYKSILLDLLIHV